MNVNGINYTATTSTSLQTARTTTANSSSFESYLGESQSLDSIFQKAAKTYNVPVNLLKSIAKAESNFNPNAVSHCGATGIMQLMPSTAKSLGVTDSTDPEQNIMGGAKLIASLLKKYDGDTSLALAAYNAGSGNVAKYGGIPPFKETQNYVTKVMNYYTSSSSHKDTSASSSPTVTTPLSTTTSSQTFQEVWNSTDQLAALTNLMTSSAEDSVETYFNYDDYMKFLDLITQESSDNEENKNNNTSNSITNGISKMQITPNIASIYTGNNLL